MQHVGTEPGLVAPGLAAVVDPVALIMLAVNRLAPATLRASTNGRRLTVAVADPAIAGFFRAALIEMCKTRGTDRLVDIVVRPEHRAALETPRPPDLTAEAAS